MSFGIALFCRFAVPFHRITAFSRFIIYHSEQDSASPCFTRHKFISPVLNLKIGFDVCPLKEIVWFVVFVIAVEQRLHANKFIATFKGIGYQIRKIVQPVSAVAEIQHIRQDMQGGNLRVRRQIIGSQIVETFFHRFQFGIGEEQRDVQGGTGKRHFRRLYQHHPAHLLADTYIPQKIGITDAPQPLSSTVIHNVHAIFPPEIFGQMVIRPTQFGIVHLAISIHIGIQMGFGV